MRREHGQKESWGGWRIASEGGTCEEVRGNKVWFGGKSAWMEWRAQERRSDLSTVEHRMKEGR